MKFLGGANQFLGGGQKIPPLRQSCYGNTTVRRGLSPTFRLRGWDGIFTKDYCFQMFPKHSKGLGSFRRLLTDGSIIYYAVSSKKISLYGEH